MFLECFDGKWRSSGNCALLNLVLVQPVTQSMHAFMGSSSFTRLN